MPAKKMPLVYLEWEDHWSLGEAGWIEAGEYGIQPLICASVGWVVGENKKGLILAANRSGAGDIGQCTYVLKGCIKKRKRLMP